MEASIHVFLFLSLILFIFTAIPLASSSSSPSSVRGLRLDLTHVDSHGNFSKMELLQRAAVRSRHRMSRLVSKTMKKSSAAIAADGAGSVRAQVHAGQGEFLMDLAIGTPSMAFSAILDTGSDLIWTQCQPCVECFDQPSPVFDPSASSTYKKLSCYSELCQSIPRSQCRFSKCKYSYTYGDSSYTRGMLSSEAFTFGSDNQSSALKIVFGCGDDNKGVGLSQASGIVGLGRGPLSLIAQLGFGKFSYCLTSLDESKKSPLFLGSSAQLIRSKHSGAVQSTPLVKNPSQDFYYYLSLNDISVGGTPLQIPPNTFALQEDGSGGLIIDSGTSVTYLESTGYEMVKAAFKSQMQLPVVDGSQVGLDLCFSLPADGSPVKVPKLVFHFDGANLDLPANNYMMMDSSSGLLCLTIMGSQEISILGNFQQQNLHILYDLKNELLYFAPVKCHQL